MKKRIFDQLALVTADVLKLRHRRGLAVVTALLTIGLVIISYVVLALLHAGNPVRHPLPGGAAKLGSAVFILSIFAAIASAIVGATIGCCDHEAGVYRDLVITGRSRLALFLSRIPAGLAYILSATVGAYAIVVGANLAFSGRHRAATAELLTLTGLWLLLEVSFYYLLALSLASLTRSRAYAVAITIAWRLAVTPLLAAATILGALRFVIPGVAMETLAPSQIASAVKQGPTISISIVTSATVLLVWVAIMLSSSAWREVRRDV